MLGIIAFLATVIQIMLMLVRGGMLVLLVGTLPLVAAFSNTEMGMQWFRKAGAWLVAFALYKPAAAIVYAVAFDLAGQPGALALLDGVMMLVLAILALPALLRFVVPATSALAGGGGAGGMLAGAAGGAIAMRMPTGAASVAQAPASAYGQGRSGGPSGAALAGGGPAAAAGMNGGAGQSGASGQNGQSGASGSTARPRQPAQHQPVALALQAAPARLEAAQRAAVREQPAQRALLAQARRVRLFRRTGPGRARRAARWSRATPTAMGRPARPGTRARGGSVMAAEAQVERTYGNWRRPRPPGLWHLGLISSVLLIVGLIAAIIVIALVGLIPGLVLLGLMLPVFLVTLRPDPHGQTPMQRLGMKLGWRRARASRSHLYRSGPLGRTPYGTFQLPGLLAASQLSEARDTYDRPFAVLCHPWCEQLTVVLETEPDGAALVDQPQVDQWVAHYGHWLAALSQEPGLVACQVSVETAPDPGTRLRHAIQGRQDPNAPELARETLSEIVRLLPGRRGRSESPGRADVHHGRGRPATDRDGDRARPRDPARRDHAAVARDGCRGRDAGRRAASVRDRSRRV